jgi:hypothetical protein
MREDDFSGGNELGQYYDLLRLRLGMPRVGNRPFRPAIAYASRAEQARVQEVAERVLAAWERVESPGLKRAIENTQKLIQASLVAAAKREQAREALAEASYACRALNLTDKIIDNLSGNVIDMLDTRTRTQTP